MEIVKQASALKAGDMVTERGGAVLTVKSVDRVGAATLQVTWERGTWIVAASPTRIRASATVRVVVTDCA